METSAQLVILPASPASNVPDAPVSPGQLLFGLPLIRRSVLSAVRAGIDRVLVITHEPSEMKQVLDGTPAAVVSSQEPITLNPGRVLLLAAHVLPDSQWLKRVVGLPLEPEQLYKDGDLAAVMDLKKPQTVALKEGSPYSARGLFKTLDRELQTSALPQDAKGRYVLASPSDIRLAEDWLIQRLVKETESFMARHFERKISLALSRRLASTSITPNAITLFSLAIGFLCAPFFLSSQIPYQLTGAILFVCHAVIDGCDGELARLKFQESRWGMILDLWGDNVVHVAVFSCMGIGWSLAAQATWPLLVAAMAIVGTLGAASIVYRQSVRWTTKGIPAFTSVVQSRASAIERITDGLGNRDFIYFVLLLSVFGKAHWFLPFVAIGSPIFAVVLLYLSRKE